jgi:uncharacterized membrane protein
MSKILLTVFTLLCFTGCATLQPLQQVPQAAAQEAPETGGPATSTSSKVWITLGVIAALVAVVVLTNDDGGGGGGGGGY